MVNTLVAITMKTLLTALILATLMMSCTAAPQPAVRFDCPNCPVLVMGDSDSPEWQQLDASTEFTGDVVVLLGCHYGYQTDAADPKFGLRDKGNGPRLGSGEHLALVWPTDGMAPGICYEMTARHGWKVGERPPPAPKNVHYFDVIEIKPLSQRDWERWKRWK